MQRLTEREKSKRYCASLTVIEMACDVWRANLAIEELKDFFYLYVSGICGPGAAPLCSKSNSVPYCNGVVKVQATAHVESTAWALE